jgi:hypothetical protein
VTTPWFSRRSDARPTTAARRARNRRRLAIEPLETRQVLSTVFTVTTDEDSGAGSLRDAINQANALAPNTPVTIDFSIGFGAQTIELQSALPTLANPITLDGTTQPGYNGRPVIQVDGVNAGSGVVGFSLDDDSHNSTIKGLEVTGFNGGGILDDNGNGNVFTDDIIGLHYTGNLPRDVANGTFGIEIRDQANGNTISNVVVAGNQYNGIVINNSMNNTVTASDIGTDLSGEDSLDLNAVALGNGVAGGGSGIVLNGAANHNTISNDVIVDNQSYGVYITDVNTSANVLTGNHIGIDKAGTTALGNVLDGVALVNGANGNFIGQAGNGNVLSGNGRNGVFLSGVDSVGDRTAFNTVAGNLIGTNAAGTAAVPNAQDGVAITAGAIDNAIGSPATGTGTVTQTGGNVISGNSQWGAYISDSGTSFNVVQNDFIGTDLTGKKPVANGFNGLDVVNTASSNTVGGTAAASRNVISGNANEGVLIGLGATKNVVEGNFIGTDVTGKAALANQLDGVYVGLGAVNNTIGDPNSSNAQNFNAYNVISGNGNYGIKVTDSGTSGTNILGNFVGTDSTGTAAVPNQLSGVLVAAGTSGTFIGSASSGSGNLNVISGNRGHGVELDAPGTIISFTLIGTDVTGQKPLGNGGDGVYVNGVSGTDMQLDVVRNNGGYGIQENNGASNNAFRTSSIFNNALGGIVEQSTASTQPAPVLSSVSSVGGKTTIVGTITNSPTHSTPLSLDFFASPFSTAPATIQGQTFLGSGTVTTDANGNATFTITLNTTVPTGQIVTATSSVGLTTTSQFSNPVTVPAAVTSGAAFLGTDTTDQGSWRNAFGADGYDIAGDTSATNPKLPSYATLAVTGAQTYVWAASTTDPRALQNAAGTGRIAGTFYSGSAFSFDLNLTDGKAHEVSLYALDWDNAGRTETVRVKDAATGTVLDTETLGGFQGGKYLSWNLSGHVVITVTNTGPKNAVVSGLFFGGLPAATVGSSAAFLGTDATTEGSWHGVYGADGYDIAGDTSTGNPRFPSYATVTLTGANNYTWAASTTDPRALQNAANTGRLASTWYNGQSFSFNVNITDGKAHKVSLYALDWDNGGRTEQVQVIDNVTGKVLDTETISSFRNGKYVSWNITGNVTIKVTKTAGVNAVVSGLFFG